MRKPLLHLVFLIGFLLGTAVGAGTLNRYEHKAALNGVFVDGATVYRVVPLK
jgi:hypothetical protein